MSVPLRHLWVAALSVIVLVAVSACGSDAGPAAKGSSPGLGAVTITGAVGTAPDVTWSSRMSASPIEKDTVVTGAGAAVTDGQSVLAQIWIGNGYSKEQAYSSFEAEGAQVIGAADSIPPIAEALKGATVGSRIAVAASADDAFGKGSGGNPSLGIGNQDGVLFVVDVLSAVADAPSGTQTPAPAWMPTITFTDGNPSAFDFTGVPQPVGTFRKATLIAGGGERVRKEMTVAVRYLGQVYAGAMPFDENYSKATTTFQIGVGKVIAGWDKQVVGSTVGSRIVIEVPPKLGYGDTGNEAAGIKGTDTLYFVIDILAAG